MLSAQYHGSVTGQFRIDLKGVDHPGDEIFGGLWAYDNDNQMADSPLDYGLSYRDSLGIEAGLAQTCVAIAEAWKAKLDQQGIAYTVRVNTLEDGDPSTGSFVLDVVGIDQDSDLDRKVIDALIDASMGVIGPEAPPSGPGDNLGYGCYDFAGGGAYKHFPESAEGQAAFSSTLAGSISFWRRKLVQQFFGITPTG